MRERVPYPQLRYDTVRLEVRDLETGPLREPSFNLQIWIKKVPKRTVRGSLEPCRMSKTRTRTDVHSKVSRDLHKRHQIFKT